MEKVIFFFRKLKHQIISHKSSWVIIGFCILVAILFLTFTASDVSTYPVGWEKSFPITPRNISIKNMHSASRGNFITVIYEAAESIYYPIHDQPVLSQIQEKYHLPEQVILFVGTIEPRKNLPTLVRAFHNLLSQYKLEVDLAIVGKQGWLYDDVYRQVEELNLKDRVHFLGRVPTADLPHLYNASQMLVLPSYYEGFGLPPLEAMACGVPVIVSDTPALTEAVADAALRVAPEDDEGLTVAMWRLLSDDGLRADMIAKGLKRADSFSWKRAAQETLDVYRRVAGKL